MKGSQLFTESQGFGNVFKIAYYMGQSFEVGVTQLIFETRAVIKGSIHQHHTFKMY
jgi:hypothetical protein